MSRYDPQSVLSPMQKIEVRAWYQAKKTLGTFKTKAKEMKVPVHVISHFVGHQRKVGKL